MKSIYQNNRNISFIHIFYSRDRQGKHLNRYKRVINRQKLHQFASEVNNTSKVVGETIALILMVYCGIPTISRIFSLNRDSAGSIAYYLLFLVCRGNVYLFICPLIFSPFTSSLGPILLLSERIIALHWVTRNRSMYTKICRIIHSY